MGFDDDDSCNNKNDEEDVTNDNVAEVDHDLKKDDEVKKDVETTSCQTEAPGSNVSWNFLKLRKSSKYCVNKERAEKRNWCFWFVQKLFD